MTVIKTIALSRECRLSMRRFAADGVATRIAWGANLRTLRHVISMRTDNGAEEEIRLVFDDVARVMTEEAPHLFADYERDDTGRWATKFWKV
jgi:thymidylate synthase (FAD)